MKRSEAVATICVLEREIDRIRALANDAADDLACIKVSLDEGADLSEQGEVACAALKSLGFFPVGMSEEAAVHQIATPLPAAPHGTKLNGDPKKRPGRKVTKDLSKVGEHSMRSTLEAAFVDGPLTLAGVKAATGIENALELMTGDAETFVTWRGRRPGDSEDLDLWSTFAMFYAIAEGARGIGLANCKPDAIMEAFGCSRLVAMRAIVQAKAAYEAAS